MQTDPEEFEFRHPNDHGLLLQCSEYMDSKLTNANGETFLECVSAEVLDVADGIDVNPLEVPDDPQTGNKQNFMKVVYQVATSLQRYSASGISKGRFFEMQSAKSSLLTALWQVTRPHGATTRRHSRKCGKY
jgi:hypothetical protein